MRSKIIIKDKNLLKWFMIMQLAVILTFLGHPKCIEASRRKIDVKQKLEQSNSMHWTTVINDKKFDVYVDRNAETIIIRGEVNTVYEKEKVEEYFRLKSPRNYKIICELDIT